MPDYNHDIKWYQRINPLFWVGNLDDPEPPYWYMPNDKEWWRKICWAFRNPLHNFTFYTIGVADRDTEVMTKISGNWVFSMTKLGILRLPFVRYYKNNGETDLYIGWRHSGAFGIKIVL